MRPGGVHETVLYASDLRAAERFYAALLGVDAFPWAEESAGLGFRLASGAVLLVFDPARAGRPGRMVPSHGATGPGHVCFAIDEREYAGWVSRLKELGIEIEQEIEWPAGPDGESARSVYFRDPAGNSVELMAGDYWASVEER